MSSESPSAWKTFGTTGSAANPDELRVLHEYSPYHRVIEGASYPAVLLITYESDTRVDPVHARKLTARLQAAMSSRKPVILRRETSAGHATKAVSRVIDEMTDLLVFLYTELDISVM